jgi:hypothetical protein
MQFHSAVRRRAKAQPALQMRRAGRRKAGKHGKHGKQTELWGRAAETLSQVILSLSHTCKGGGSSTGVHSDTRHAAMRVRATTQPPGGVGQTSSLQLHEGAYATPSKPDRQPQVPAAGGSVSDPVYAHTASSMSQLPVHSACPVKFTPTQDTRFLCALSSWKVLQEEQRREEGGGGMG